MTRRPTKFSV